MKTIEVWKPVIDYESLYEVSDLGRIRSLRKLLNPTIGSTGYLRVTLSKNSKVKTFKLHVLIAKSFLDSEYVEKGLVVDHINHNRLDNRLVNLRIVSYRENNSYQRGSSNCVGVSYCKHTKKWRASINYLDKTYYLGYFVNELDACQAYKEALYKVELNTFNPLLDKPVHKNKYTGVIWNKRASKWLAVHLLNGKMKHIGFYNTEEEGNFARLLYIKMLNL